MIRKINFVAVTASLLVIILSLIVMFGWFTSNKLFIQVSENFVPMQFNTALCFLLIGLGLLLTNFNYKKFVAIFCSIAAFIAFITILQDIFNISFYIDEVFFKHYITTKTSHPGRMAPTTATCFILASICTFGFNFTRNIF